jgi:hypothetical protein
MRCEKIFSEESALCALVYVCSAIQLQPEANILTQTQGPNQDTIMQCFLTGLDLLKHDAFGRLTSQSCAPPRLCSRKPVSRCSQSQRLVNG